MKNFNQFNESIRDKMTPKSTEEIKIAYNNLIKNINNPVSKYPNEINNEFQEIADLFKLTKEDLHLITTENEEWDRLNELFTTLTESNDYKNIIVEETENEYGGVWQCWINKKLAYWENNNMDDVNAWIFCKDSIITESIRDKMLPKSEDEIRKSLERLPNSEKFDRGMVYNLPWLIKMAIDEGYKSVPSVDNALYKACNKGYYEIVNILLDGIKFRAYVTDVALRRAITFGHIEVVKILLDKGGVDIHFGNDIFFKSAVEFNQPDILKLLKEYDKKNP